MATKTLKKVISDQPKLSKPLNKKVNKKISSDANISARNLLETNNYNKKQSESDFWKNSVLELYGTISQTAVNTKKSPKKRNLLRKGRSSATILSLKHKTLSRKTSQTAKKTSLKSAQKSAEKPSRVFMLTEAEKKLANKSVKKSRNKNKRVITPRAYKIKDVYEFKKRERLRKRMEEERQAREFRSRPAPKQHHSYKLSLLEVPPMDDRKCRPKMPEENCERESENEFHNWSFTYNKEKALDLRIREAEAAQKTIDDQIYREMRKITQFKARPNPFKTETENMNSI